MNTMKNIDRGDIYYVDKDPRHIAVSSEIYAARPAIVLSSAMSIAQTGLATVVYLTTSPKADLPIHVKINCDGKKSIALCEQVNTVSIERFGTMMGVCSETEMEQIERGVCRALALEPMEKVSTIKDGETESLKEELLTAQKDAKYYKTLYNAIQERFLNK